MSMNRFLGFVAFCLLISLASSSYISDGVFESHRSTGRSLLQAQKNCPINFENQNYTILTCQCKGPKYPKDQCCNAFKEFACPFSEQLNDGSNNCATIMFSYINLYGKYPPGTFANMCKEGKEGLSCEDVKSANGVSKSSKTNNAHAAYVASPLAVILISSLVFLFCLV